MSLVNEKILTTRTKNKSFQILRRKGKKKIYQGLKIKLKYILRITNIV